MKNTYIYLNILLLSSMIILGSACSSSGGGGGNDNAEITAENMEALATAGTEGAKQAANNSNTPTPFAKLASSSVIQDVTVSLAQSVSQNPKQDHLGFSLCDTGSVDDGNFNENGGTIVYNNCTFTGSTINGTVEFTLSTSGSTTTYTIDYVNFTITTGGVIQSFDLSATCTITGTDASCTYNSTALGVDGRTYSVSGISISGNASSGYTISATVTDPDNGEITISTTTPITFNCANGQPDAGEIVVSDGSNTMTVTYNNCDSYSITFDGSTNTFFW